MPGAPEDRNPRYEFIRILDGRRATEFATPGLARGLARLALAVLFSLGPWARAEDDPQGWGSPPRSREPQGDDAAMARRLRAAGEVLSLEQVALGARTLHPGTMIDAALTYETQHGGYVYEILMLDRGGGVWELEFDARTGALIEQERKGN